VAAGSAAALVAPAATLAQTANTTRRAARTPKSTAPSASRAEIEKQKQYVAQTLKAIREFPLENRDEPAFVFRPIKAGRARKGR
jgi:hypothetical protein